VKIKLFLDEDVHLGVGMSLRKRGYDVVHVNDINRKGKSDVEQLRYAIKTERCFVSFNIKDFVILHSELVSHKFS
jgi:predicted nuclease of predicted toxin-antitoxin system